MQRWLLGAALFALGWWLAFAWLSPPGAAPADAPSEAFSAERAVRELARVLGDQHPHPVGTQANALVRDRLREALRGHGLDVQEQSDIFCGEHCARVVNLITTVPGTDPTLAPILVSSHYDSVASGPGAGDAGAAVGAMLELARLLKAHPVRRPVRLLFNEGEEAGLLGAQLYLQQPIDVAAVINLEARGTGGNAFLFELKGAALPWIRRYARHATAPSVSSLYTAIYDLLPNNTDATVYGEQLPVANVAFLGGGIRYHTPRDDLEHLDPGSVQHLGEQALSLIRALQDDALHELNGEQPGVFWDLAWMVVVLPVGAAQVVCALLLVLALGSLARPLASDRTEQMWQVGRIWALLLSLVVLSAVGGGLAQGTAAVVGASWFGLPTIPWLGVVVLVFGLGTALSTWLDHCDPRLIWTTTSVLLAVFAVGLAIVLPEGCYLFAQPAAGTLMAAWLPERWRIAPGVAFLGTVPLMHLAAGLVPALGLMGPVLGAGAAIGLWAFLPLLTQAPTTAWTRTLGGSAVLLLGTLALPTWTESRPNGLLARHLTEDGHGSMHVSEARFPWPSELAWPDRPATDASIRLGERVLEAAPSLRAAPVLETLAPTDHGHRVRVVAPGSIGLRTRGATVGVGDYRVTMLRWTGEADGLELEVEGDQMWVAAVYPGIEEPLPDGFVPIHSGTQTWVATTIDLTADSFP